jgi:hypothetical protein
MMPALQRITGRPTSVADQIKAAPKDGMAMGIAMKALAGRVGGQRRRQGAVAALRQ